MADKLNAFIWVMSLTGVYFLSRACTTIIMKKITVGLILGEIQ